MAWAAASEINNGGDARPLLAGLESHKAPGLNPDVFADNLYGYLILRSEGRASPSKVWRVTKKRIIGFLDALELQSGTTGLANATRRRVERCFLDDEISLPATIGATYAVSIDIEEPITDVMVAVEGVEPGSTVLSSRAEDVWGAFSYQLSTSSSPAR